MTVPDKPLNTNSYEASDFLAIDKNADISTNELPGSDMYMFPTKIVSQHSQSSIAILFSLFYHGVAISGEFTNSVRTDTNNSM